VAPLELDLRAAQNVGEFELQTYSDWAEIIPVKLEELGVRPGVVVLVTTPENSTFLEALRSSQLGWFGLAGDAAESSLESGMFPQAPTPAQRALGLVAAMLERR
jgi:hypothetical protein